MNIQDIKRIAQNARTTIQNKVSSATGRKLMIVAGGVALLAGGAGTAMAMQSHAQSRVATTAAQVQLTHNTNQQSGQSTSAQQHAKPAAVGTVTAISGTTLTVTDTQSNTTYTVDASNASIVKVSAPVALATSSATSGTTSTAPAKPTETTITASDIAVGDTVMVEGSLSGTSVTATKIVDGQMFGGPGGFGGGHSMDAAHGTVTAISGTTLTVTDKQNNTTYTVDASNATVTKVTAPAASSSTSGTTTQPVKPTETTIAVSAIAVGDTVSVQGTVSGTTITATTIHDGQFFGGMGGHSGPGGMIGQKPAVAGTVTAVSGSTLTVTDKQSSTTYTVDATNATVKKIVDATASTTSAQPTKPTETTITASEIAVGDTVMVQGTVSGTTVTATSVTDGNFQPPHFGGRHNGSGPKPSSSASTSGATANN